MSEDKDLLAKISQLAGHINRHKAQQDSSSHLSHRSHPYSRPASTDYRTSTTSRPYRGTSYGRPHGRGGYSHTHRNRTLVLNNNGHESGTSSPVTPGPNETGTPGGWIAKRDRHMQLINTSIYDKETQARAKAIEETRKLKAKQRDEREKFKLTRHLQKLATQNVQSSPSVSVPSSASVHEITINDIHFRVADGGSKLTRVSDDPNSARATPKSTKIGGVMFFRSKNGNLYRSGIVKAKRKHGTVKKRSELCKRFATTGSCLKGPLCPFVHDPNKVAICKEFLQTGNCLAGEACDLSHEPTPKRVPTCLHFLRGKCSNPNCRYAHVRVNPGAPVCRAFATLGYCDKGINCPERHVHECPDYANTGSCRNKKCRLPHIDRAGQIRKATAKSAEAADGKHSSSDEESDLSSEEEDYDEIDSDDVDSDTFEEEDLTQYATGQPDNADVSRQKDFIHF
ncbi:CCCH zinc finger protein [Xylona heveae TC161]|uniref:CCCH zinc finger protein n=1 Tax=Xylona heveae (strain CBS 132557 / TC161) TaxID=1328760 RepID=A0A165HR13_XYLHT|nr:CCCH zinc finger protein [Xylona heveae TC161]KZF23854.1 CCCH zinc finger protein [Xylona heveae TC161]